ncbi:ATP-binding cassette sub-family B member 5 isoform 3-T3 [Porphyrio hochstetteri]
MKDHSINSAEKDLLDDESTNKGCDNLSFQHDENLEQSDQLKPKKKKKEKEKLEKQAVGIFELFRYADWVDVLLMVVGLIAAAANGTGLPLMIIVFGEMTNSFVLSGVKSNVSEDTSANSSSCPSIPGIDIEREMTKFAYYYVGIGCAVLILSTIQVWTFLIAATRQTARIRQKFFFAVLHQEMAWFDTTQIGTLNTRLTDDINTIHEGIGDKICIFVQFFATFLAGIIIGFIHGWKLTLVILSVSPLLAASAAVWSTLLASLTAKELSAYAKAGAVAEEILTAIKTVVAFNGQQKALAKYDANLEMARSVGVKKSITTNTSLGVSQFLIFGSYALAFWYGTKLTAEEENYDIGRVLIVFFSVLIGAFSLGQAAPNLESVANARGAAYEVYRVISKKRLIDSSSKEGYKPDKLIGEIEFRNIHFNYPSRPDIKARTGRTTIVIAHRLSTIRTADTIAGFENGVVVEQGTHSELMLQKGVYYSLVMQQGYSNNIQDDGTSEESEDTGPEEYEECGRNDLMEELAVQDHPEESAVSGRGSIRRRSSRYKSKGRPSKKKFAGKKKKKELEEENLPAVPYSRILALNKPEWLYVLLGVIAAAISGGVHPAFAVIFGKIIGAFQETDPEKRNKNTLVLSLMFLLLGVITLAAHIIQGFMFGKSGEMLTMRLRSLSFRALLQQEIGWYDDQKNAVGVLLTRLATDASQVKGATGSRLGLMTMTVFTLLTAIIIAFVYGWQLTLLILACIPFVIATNAARVSSVSGHAAKDQKALEEAGRISTESVENIRTVASLTREEAFYERYVTSLNGPYRDSLTKAPFYGFTYGVAQCANYFINAAVFRFGAWLIAHCLSNFENVFIVFSSVIFAAMNVGQSASLAPDYGKARMSAQRIFKLLDRKPLIDSYSEEGEKLGNFEGNIEFRNIHFVYPTRPEAQVLQGLNVKVNKGQTLALVGSSGCGKSTSIQLLERFYDPVEGQVLADGFDTKSLHLQWLRSRLGLVSQEPILFDCSIAENIQYGDNSRVVSQEEIEEAAKAANIHTFIEKLPEKYNTQVGDKGTQLSGGQKQRIAIARALVRNPAVLLLDEATSALDTESEKIVQKALDNARQGRTCIVIAHRLSTVQTADIIAVIQNGRVVEQGTHSQLLAKEGHYYALVNTQVSN